MAAGYSPLQTAIDFFRFLCGRVPGQLVIQLSDRCNAACPQCDMNRNNPISRRRLGQIELEGLIRLAAVRGFRSLSFTGGEPFLYYKDLLRLIRCAHEHKIPMIRTGTNAFFMRACNQAGYKSKIKRMAHELSSSGLRNLWISIDSKDPQTHEEIRGLPGVISGIGKSLPLFHSEGLYPAANLGINRLVGGAHRMAGDMDENALYQYMKESLAGFFDFVIELGFTMANVCYPMGSTSLEEEPTLLPVYGAYSPHAMVQFQPREKAVVFRALREVIPRYRKRIRIFSPLSSLYALERQITEDADFAFPCRGGLDFFFISARDGNLYPCGYRGQECLGSFSDWRRQPQSPCRLCEWECFRDPSELMGPLYTGLRQPWRIIQRFREDKIYSQLWWSDLRYYRSCLFFDGRLAPESTSISRGTWESSISDCAF